MNYMCIILHVHCIYLILHYYYMYLPPTSSKLVFINSNTCMELILCIYRLAIGTNLQITDIHIYRPIRWPIRLSVHHYSIPCETWTGPNPHPCTLKITVKPRRLVTVTLRFALTPPITKISVFSPDYLIFSKLLQHISSS